MICDYAQLRYNLATQARVNRDTKSLQAGILLCERIQDSLIIEGRLAGKIPDTDVSSFIQSIYSIVDLNMRRIENVLFDRIPRTLKILMYVMALMGLTAMGYSSGLKGGRSLAANLILVIVFATIIGIILDMDHPANSLFKVSQQPMLDVLRRISSIRF
jgi:hypothetical protein